MNNHIKPASIDDKHTIHDLFQPYFDELTGFPDDEPEYKDEDGIYRYPYLDNYWQEDSRYPYLLYCDDRIAGFALVRHTGEHWEMAEVYVDPEFRRRSVAYDCSAELFKRHPGQWRIGFNRHNAASRALWEKLTQKLAKESVETGHSDSSHDFVRFSV